MAVVDAVQGFGDASGHGRDGVGVASYGNGVADAVLEAVGLQRADDGFRRRSLTGHVEAVPGPYLVHGSIHVVSVLPGDDAPDALGGAAVVGQPDGMGNRQCALDALRMVMGYHREALGVGQGRLQIAPVEEGGGRNPHTGAVAVTPIGPGPGGMDPRGEPTSVAAARITAAPPLHTRGGVQAVHQNVGRRDGAHRIVGEPAAAVPELELLALAAHPPSELLFLETRPHYVADYRSIHDCILPLVTPGPAGLRRAGRTPPAPGSVGSLRPPSLPARRS